MKSKLKVHLLQASHDEMNEGSWECILISVLRKKQELQSLAQSVLINKKLNQLSDK